MPSMYLCTVQHNSVPRVVWSGPVGPVVCSGPAAPAAPRRAWHVPREAPASCCLAGCLFARCRRVRFLSPAPFGPPRRTGPEKSTPRAGICGAPRQYRSDLPQNLPLCGDASYSATIRSTVPERRDQASLLLDRVTRRVTIAARRGGRVRGGRLLAGPGGRAGGAPVRAGPAPPLAGPAAGGAADVRGGGAAGGAAVRAGRVHVAVVVPAQVCSSLVDSQSARR